MRAAVIHRYGGPEVLHVEDVAEPPVGPNDVLVAVHATSVNPIDTKIRAGAMRLVIRYELPRALGMDVSGVVVAVGEKVTRFVVGDEVFASTSHKAPGTYAELTSVDEGFLARKPRNLTHEEAASLPLVFLTAWQALVDTARLAPGERLFVQAGSGGVGTVAIQIGKHLGAEVATTCSGRNAELVTRLGADRVIDYTQEAFDEVLEGYDVVLDALGDDTLKRARAIGKRGARLIGVSPGAPKRVAKYGPVLGFAATGAMIAGQMLGSRVCRGQKTRFVTRRSDGEQLAELARLCEAGAIVPVVDRVLPLAEIVEAHRYSETGRARGKIVVKVR